MTMKMFRSKGFLLATLCMVSLVVEQALLANTPKRHYAQEETQERCFLCKYWKRLAAAAAVVTVGGVGLYAVVSAAREPFVTDRLNLFSLRHEQAGITGASRGGLYMTVIDSTKCRAGWKRNVCGRHVTFMKNSFQQGDSDSWLFEDAAKGLKLSREKADEWERNIKAAVRDGHAFGQGYYVRYHRDATHQSISYYEGDADYIEHVRREHGAV